MILNDQDSVEIFRGNGKTDIDFCWDRKNVCYSFHLLSSFYLNHYINEGVCTYLVVGVVGWTAAKDIVGKGDLNSLSVSWFILASDLRSDEDFLCHHRIVSCSKERRTDFFFVIIKITQHNEDNTAYFHSFTGSCKLQ